MLFHITKKWMKWLDLLWMLQFREAEKHLTGICCKSFLRQRNKYYLPGGLNPDNVGEALAACAGKIDGVDTSSGVERADGNGKSKERIEAFVRAVRGSSEK